MAAFSTRQGFTVKFQVEPTSKYRITDDTAEYLCKLHTQTQEQWADALLICQQYGDRCSREEMIVARSVCEIMQLSSANCVSGLQTLCEQIGRTMERAGAEHSQILSTCQRGIMIAYAAAAGSAYDALCLDGICKSSIARSSAVAGINSASSGGSALHVLPACEWNDNLIHGDFCDRLAAALETPSLLVVPFGDQVYGRGYEPPGALWDLFQGLHNTPGVLVPVHEHMLARQLGVEDTTPTDHKHGDQISPLTLLLLQLLYGVDWTVLRAYFPNNTLAERYLEGSYRTAVDKRYSLQQMLGTTHTKPVRGSTGMLTQFSISLDRKHAGATARLLEAVWGQALLLDTRSKSEYILQNMVPALLLLYAVANDLEFRPTWIGPRSPFTHILKQQLVGIGVLWQHEDDYVTLGCRIVGETYTRVQLLYPPTSQGQG